MEVHIKYNNKSYMIDLSMGQCISIPYNYNGEQPNFYNADAGTSEPMIQGNFVGNISNNKGCKVSIIKQNIHCSGTHTECVGHILDKNIFIHEILDQKYHFTKLLTLQPINAKLTKENYHCKLADSDFLITKKMIIDKVPDNCTGLVIRTIPNDKSKKRINYSSKNTSFFTSDAIEYINNLGIKHLVVDMPTIDRYDDGGILGNHHLFFEKIEPYNKTITELAFINNRIKDGLYFMSINIPPMMLDAAPSRVFLFKIME